MGADVAASETIADMLLNAEESWLQRLADPSAPLPSTHQCYDGGLHDLNTPVKNLWVHSFRSIVGYFKLMDLTLMSFIYRVCPPPDLLTQKPPGPPHL